MAKQASWVAARVQEEGAEIRARHQPKGHTAQPRRQGAQGPQKRLNSVQFVPPLTL